MNLSEFISSQTVWAADHSRLTAFIGRVQAEANTPVPSNMTDDMLAAMYPPLPAMTVKGNLAVIPIQGMICKGMSTFEQRSMGLCDISTLSNYIQQAQDNPDITKIIFAIDSPGGSVSGIPELVEQIAELTATPGKTTAAYCEDICASAAYWLASACGSIYATGSAMIGGIGCYSTFVDRSDMAAKAGLKVQVFSSGSHKGAGEPGTSLTEDQAQAMQDRVDYVASLFKGQVQSLRPVDDEDMQGQTFYGSQAVDKGLVDGLVSDMPQASRKRGLSSAVS